MATEKTTSSDAGDDTVAFDSTRIALALEAVEEVSAIAALLLQQFPKGMLSDCSDEYILRTNLHRIGDLAGVSYAVLADDKTDKTEDLHMLVRHEPMQAEVAHG